LCIKLEINQGYTTMHGQPTINILIYVQQYATLHSLFHLETALHVSDVTTTHHQELIQLYLQHLVFVRPLLLPAVIAAGSSNGLTNTRCWRYSCLRSWWWVEVPPETCRAVSRWNKLCNVAYCWTYIRISEYELEKFLTFKNAVMPCRFFADVRRGCKDLMTPLSWQNGLPPYVDSHVSQNLRPHVHV